MSFPKRNPSIPRLLVSVRSGNEARAAIAGGCDILDVKEPTRGSLGMADAAAIEQVIAVAQDCGENDILVSAALGEARDWLESGDVPRLPTGLQFVKLGLATLGSEAGWQNRWREVRSRFEDRAACGLNWIAVAYADHVLARSPEPNSIVEAAAAADCAGVLLDTFSKSGRNLLDWMSAEQVARLAAQIAELGMTFAVAGSLQTESLAELADVPADIIAVRTAACRHGDRGGNVCTDAVRQFKIAMTAAFEPTLRSIA